MHINETSRRDNSDVMADGTIDKTLTVNITELIILNWLSENPQIQAAQQ